MGRVGRRSSNSRIHHLLNYSDKKLFIVFFILAAALVVDNSFSQVADLVRDQIVSFWGWVLFVAIAATYATCQFLIMEMIRTKIKERGSGANRISMVITIVQYVLISIIVFLIVQMVVSSQYYKDLLTATTTISWISALFLTTLLTVRLLSWYKTHKQPIVLLYGLAAACMVLTGIATIVFFDAVLLTKDPLIFPESEVLFNPGYEEGAPIFYALDLIYYSQTVYILLLWGGTVLLLYHNYKRVGQAKFWTLVSLPVIAFMSIFLSFYQDIAPTSPVTEAISSNFFIPILLLLYSGYGVSVIWGLSFIFVGRILKHGINARAYMIIAGFGFILFGITSVASVSFPAYPPYGISTMAALPLSMFMVLIGLSYSAISVAQDQTLRTSIRKSVKDMKFLESIGTAQIEQDLQKRVLTIAKKNSDVMTEQTGVQPSLTEDEMKEYLVMVVNEIKRTEHDATQKK